MQLRLKDAGDETIVATARRYAAVCRAHGVPLILNDRPDLVTAAGADGVHVGQDDTPVAQARALVGPDRIVGLSTHSPAQIDAAAADPRSTTSGWVRSTPRRPSRAARPSGWISSRYAAAHAATPFFAIGGIDAGNVAAVRAAGRDADRGGARHHRRGRPGTAARALRSGSEASVGAT